VPPREREYTADFESSEIAATLVDDIHVTWFTRPAGAGARNGVRPHFLELGSDPISERLEVLREVPFFTGREP
jgi:hypothetical protein